MSHGYHANVVRFRIVRYGLAAALAAGCMAIVPAGMAFAQSIDEPLTVEESVLAEQFEAVQDSQVAACSADGAGDVSEALGCSVRALSDYWRWPLPGIDEGMITQDFHSGHGALDIAAPKGTPIVAARGGTVVSDEAMYPVILDGYGNCVVVDHGDGTFSYYAHMTERYVSVGDTVAQGDVIGTVGDTGVAFGDHLHFEIRVASYEGEPYYYADKIDPYPYIAGNDAPNVNSPSADGVWFADVDFADQNCWYAEDVNKAVLWGLMAGKGNDRFDPDGTLTRGEAVTILARAAGVAGGLDGSVNTTPFVDNLPGMFYTGPINWAKQIGVVSGDGDHVSPDEAISREELAVMIARYASVVRGADVGASREVLYDMPDWQTASSWALDPFAWALSRGIINGIGQNDGSTLLAPHATATRAQMASIIVRAIETVG